jgi:hypothetical protein
VLTGSFRRSRCESVSPMVSPFPLSPQRGVTRADAHRNPMEPFGGRRSGGYRPQLVTRARCPDQVSCFRTCVGVLFACNKPGERN